LAKSLFDRVAAWPEEDLLELGELVREIEARRSGVYVVSEREWHDMQEGLLQADRKDFVPEDVVAEADKRHQK
jgi:hypothetical protein